MTLHTRLSLERPLCFFDLETTGTFPERDRIVDITIVTIFPDGNRCDFSTLVNPTIPIPPAATAVHGITDAMVADAPTFKRLAPAIAAQLRRCDLAGYNVRRFDVPLLTAEFSRAAHPFAMEDRKVVDMQAIYHKREPRDLTTALSFFCGKALEGAHRAAADVWAAIEVLTAQLDRYTDLPTTIAALHEYCKDPRWVDDTGKLVWDSGVACINFGKHRGRTLEQMAATPDGRDWCRWILREDFPADTKRLIQGALNGTLPTPPEEVRDAVVR